MNPVKLPMVNQRPPAPPPQRMVAARIAGALAWSAALAIYQSIFALWLLCERLDGKDG